MTSKNISFTGEVLNSHTVLIMAPPIYLAEEIYDRNNQERLERFLDKLVRIQIYQRESYRYIHDSKTQVKILIKKEKSREITRDEFFDHVSEFIECLNQMYGLC